MHLCTHPSDSRFSSIDPSLIPSALSMDTLTNVSMDYQFLDVQSTLNVLDMDAFSWPISVAEDVNLSRVLPLDQIDMTLIEEGTDWTTDQIDNKDGNLPRQFGLTKPYEEVLSPLEGLFPSADQALKGCPYETGTVEEVSSPVANEVINTILF